MRAYVRVFMCGFPVHAEMRDNLEALLEDARLVLSRSCNMLEKDKEDFLMFGKDFMSSVKVSSLAVPTYIRVSAPIAYLL